VSKTAFATRGPKKPPVSSFGVGLGQEALGKPWPVDGADLHQNLAYRHAIRWIHAEPTAPVGGVHAYNWANADQFFDAAVAANAKVLTLISNAPAWACPNGPLTPILPERIQDYIAFCTAVAERYGSYQGIIGYEVWNEPNLGSNGPWTAAQYKSILLPASAALRATYPGVPIVGLCLAGTAGDSGAWGTFVKPLMSDPDVRAAMDVLSCHTYCRPYMPEVGDNRGPIDVRLTDGSVNLLNVGWTGPVWVTEGGYPTIGQVSGKVSEEDQARFLVRLTIINRSFCERYFVFKLHGVGDDQNTSEAGGMGLMRTDGSRKPSFAALQECFARLGDKKPVRQADQAGARVYTFDGGAVSWRTSETSDVTLLGVTKSVSTDPVWWP